MLVMLYTIQEGEGGVMTNQTILSKPSQETKVEQEYGKLISYVVYGVEKQLIKIISNEGVIAEGKIDEAASALAKQHGVSDILKALRDAGFEPRNEPHK